MTKRLCPFDENIQDIKKHVTDECRTRGIKSAESERVLRLLFEGAAKQLLVQNKGETSKEYVSHLLNDTDKILAHCVQCSGQLNIPKKCCYCDAYICSNCVKICYKCDQEFCTNCSFPNYSESTAICYSCY